MTKINNINWANAKLYHGTTKKSWENVLATGFRIPTTERNWLGRGIYFGYNNIITPIRYAYEGIAQKSYENDEPLIVEINANYLSQLCKNRILDLTTDIGLVYFYLIANEFKNFDMAFNHEDHVIEQYKKDFYESVLYSEKVKNLLSIDINQYYFAKRHDLNIKLPSHSSKTVRDFIDLSKLNISNLIIDWYNFYISAGDENEIPIKGLLANFNTGDPILLNEKSHTKSNNGHKIFYDFISLLNRTELAILGFEYYRAYVGEQTWPIFNLFEDNNCNFVYYESENAIKNKLMNIIKEIKFPHLSEEMVRDSANLLLGTIKEQADQL